MKKLITLGITMLLCLSGFSQPISAENVPDPIKKSFYGRFGQASLPKWSREDRVYTARFFQGQKEYTARFERDGSWISTRQDITAADLPADVAATLRSLYPAFEVLNAAEVNSANAGINYELVLENKGGITYHLLLSDKGSLLLKVEEDETY